MTAATDPLWTDYVSAIGAVASVIVAYIALRIAKGSAADATRSAEAAQSSADASKATSAAADAQLKLARAAHERAERDRARRPIVERLELTTIDPQPGEIVPAEIFRIGFKNSGDRPLMDAVLTVLIDPAASAEVTNRWGTARRRGPDDDTRERWPGVDGPPRRFAYFALGVDAPAGLSLVTYMRITRRGRFSLRVKLFHSDLAGDGPWIDAAIEVAPDSPTLIDFLNDASERSVHGRCSDFADLPGHLT